jgi:hypothetical protein
MIISGRRNSKPEQRIQIEKKKAVRKVQNSLFKISFINEYRLNVNNLIVSSGGSFHYRLAHGGVRMNGF